MQPIDFNALEKKYGKLSLAAPVQKPKTQGRGGFGTSLISELGGAGGAAGGAAIGTALLPGVGTLAGAILGGFLGGTGGRVAENEVRDSRVGLGDALKEGALSGALSGAGELFSGAKAAKGVGNFLKGGAEAGAKTGVIEGVGQGLERGASNIGIGAKVTGEQPLTASASDAIKDTFKKLGIKAGSPEAQAKTVDRKIAQLGEQLSQKYAKNTVRLGTEEADSIGHRILGEIASRPGLDEASKNYALNEVENLVKNHAKDTSSLWNYAKQLEADGINFAANPDATTAGRQVVNKIVSQNVRDTLSSRLPGLAETNGLYSDAINAQKYILSAAKDRTGGGLFGKVTSLSPVKSAESKLGSALGTVGKFTAGTGGPVTQVTNNLIRQAPGNLAEAISGAMSQQMAPANQSVDSGISGIDSLNGMAGTDIAQDTGQSDLNTLNQQIDAAIRQDLATTGGKNINNLLAYQDFYSKNMASNGTSAAPNITKVTAQQYGLAQSGQQALQQLYDKISSDPGIINKTAVPGQSLPGIGGFISNAAGTGGYNAIGYNIADSILRLRTGAQANESEIKKLQTQIMPRPGDSPQTIKTKLQQISEIFGSVLSVAGSTPSSSGGLSDAILQAQGGQ